MDTDPARKARPPVITLAARLNRQKDPDGPRLGLPHGQQQDLSQGEAAGFEVVTDLELKAL